MRAFIEQALWDRYDAFVGNNEILDEFLDDLVDLYADCGIPEGCTARTIIDNRYVNGERWTYEEYWEDYMNEQKAYKWTEKQKDKIEEHMQNNWYCFKRDKEIRTSFY